AGCFTRAKRRNRNGRGSNRHWMTVQWQVIYNEIKKLNGTLGVWSRALMVHYFLPNGRRHYGPGSTRQRHDDRGSPSSNTK
ncbi:hypothetical protein NKI20_33130, partial [Mesorhizobium sp. M0830]